MRRERRETRPKPAPTGVDARPRKRHGKPNHPLNAAVDVRRRRSTPPDPTPSKPPSTLAGGDQPRRTPPLKAAVDDRRRRSTPPDPTPSKPPSTSAGGDQP